MTFLVSYVKESPSLPHTLKSLLVSLFADDFLVPSNIEKGKWFNFVLIPFCKPHPLPKGQKVTLCFDTPQIPNYPPKAQKVTLCFDTPQIPNYPPKGQKVTLCFETPQIPNYPPKAQKVALCFNTPQILNYHRKGKKSHYVLILRRY